LQELLRVVISSLTDVRLITTFPKICKVQSRSLLSYNRTLSYPVTTYD